MLGIMPVKDDIQISDSSSDDEEPKEKDKKSKKSSMRRKKEKKRTVREVLPAKYIKTTRVKTNTLNPLWNEKFRFDIDDIYSDKLHLDIWDHDDEVSVFDAAKRLNEVSGFKGLGRFFKQVAQSARTSSSGSVDDFLGCINLMLSDIPSTGIDRVFKLEGRTQRSNIQGEIHIKLNLATREDRGIPEDDNWTDIRQHEDLMCLFIEHELKKFHDSSYHWKGVLPPAALTILHQHAIQGDITEAQQAMCRWLAYSRKHREHPLNYELLLKLLQDLEEKWTTDAFSREEEELLAESFTKFIDYCLKLLRKQRDIFPSVSKKALTKLEFLLKCLAFIYEMKVFRGCCPFQKELHSELLSVIKKGNMEWYEKIHSISRAFPKSDEEAFMFMIETTNSLNAEMMRAQIFYNSLYKDITDVEYFNITYRQLEKLLADEFVQNVEHRLSCLEQDEDLDSLTMGTTLFELYLALQDFSKFKEHIPQSDWESLTITQYFEWFKPSVKRWLAIAKQKAIKRIHKALDLDKSVKVDATVKYSSSAVDVCCCFTQIIEFWKQLAWPDAIESYKLVKKLTEDICEGAVLYADLIHEKLIRAGYYDEEGQFDVTEQLCITINNIEHVRRSLKSLPETLKFSEIHDELERLNRNHGGKSLNYLIRNADENMISKIKQAVDRVADKMRPDIKKDVFHLNWAPESVPADDAIGDLLEYLDSNLLTLNKNLLKPNFERILESIWVETLEEFKEVLDKEEMRAPVLFQRMYDAIGLLVEFFFANEKGLTMERIHSQQYHDLRLSLQLHKEDTLSLIEIFFEEKIREQKNFHSREYGILNLRCSYRADSDTLLVEVLNAKDVLPLDANGLSDPYVTIQIFPEHLFPNVSVQQTKIIKKTLNPVFDEMFEFNVDCDKCNHQGAVLVLTVMDHDIMFQNDFAGEVFLPLRDIHGMDGDEVTGFEALQVTSFNLMQPTHKENGAFTVLSKRISDKAAQDFIKKRIKTEDQAVNSAS